MILTRTDRHWQILVSGLQLGLIVPSEDLLHGCYSVILCLKKKCLMLLKVNKAFFIYWVKKKKGKRKESITDDFIGTHIL